MIFDQSEGKSLVKYQPLNLPLQVLKKEISFLLK